MNKIGDSARKYKIIAWSIHFLTASGAALGLWAIISVFKGQIQLSLWLMATTVIIDAMDGSLARIFRIKERLPGIDGSLLDNIVDYFTWTIVPFVWGIQVMHISLFVAGVSVTAALFGFSNVKAKTGDHFFTGFPNYWNMVLFHLYVLHAPLIFIEAILLTGAVLIFIPLKWIYPSRTLFLRKMTLGFSSVYAIQLIVMLWLFDQIPEWLAWTSLFFPLYYIALTLYINFTRKTIQT